MRPSGVPGGGPRSGGQYSPGGPGASGGFRQGGGPPSRGGPAKAPAKAEPSKDDRKAQWSRDSQARTAKKDRKDTDRKENRQGLDRKIRTGAKPVKKVMPTFVAPVITQITVAPEITVRDLAEKLHKSNADIIKILIRKGLMVTANQLIDFETASYVAETFDVLVEEYVEVDVFEQAFSVKPDSEEELESRPPVVVVMGHVDHGKTSLLDVIRNANVQSGEAGGITQHIGAYSATINNKAITFLDTPGHEAFTAMRMRGAQVTDIAILVVAADDGVMPQTIEAINHAKAAGVDIIVAITMMDKPSANPDRVKQQLTDHGLQPEDWGGQTITVPVSALKKQGIDTLLEMILLVSEMKELKANPLKSARGSIIEAKLDKGRGPVATVLVQEGTLKVGDPVVAGACYGKIRAMIDGHGRSVKEAGPSTPVEIIGLSEVPATGDILYTAANERQARQLSETVVAKGRENLIKSTQGKISLDDLFNQIQAGQVKDLNVVVKGDVQGSVEALRGSLEKLSNTDVRVRTIHTGVGAITESDVMLASASNAIIIGFNVRPDASAKTTAEAENVDIRLYSVIYAAIDDIEAAMKGMLDPEFREVVLGHAEIRQIFKASGVGTIGGCMVLDGKITRSAKVRLVRDGRVIYDGTLETLKRFKDDAREVNSGYECGMLFKNYNDIRENDRVEAYIMEEIPR
jgi:translation initiation factor IF-2